MEIADSRISNSGTRHGRPRFSKVRERTRASARRHTLGIEIDETKPAKEWAKYAVYSELIE
jgi:hypothetical protein